MANVDPTISYSNFLNWNKSYLRKVGVPVKPRGKKQGEKDICWFAKELLGITLHEGQKKWLKESTKEGRKKNVLVPGNQFGKTFVTTIKHLWYCYYRIGMKKGYEGTYETLNISPHLRQVKNMYEYVLQILQGRIFWEENGKIIHNNCQIKDFLVGPKEIPHFTNMSYTPIKFKNGARMYCASTGGDQGAGLAGGQFAYISYDECALSHHLQDELPARIMSRLIKYGIALDLVGTPDAESESSMYYQRLVDKGFKGEDGWYAQAGMLDDNIFISKKQRDEIKKEIKTLDLQKYNQVVLGQFIKKGGAIFPADIVANIFDKSLGKKEDYQRSNDIYIFEKPRMGRQYIIGCDWAVASDYTVFCVLDYTLPTLWLIVAWYRVKGIEKPPTEQYLDLINLKNLYSADIMMDTNGLGGKIIESDLRELGAEGFNFGPGRKAGFIQNLKKALFAFDGKGKIRAPLIPELEEELACYNLKNESKLRTDCVMSLGLCTWFCEEEEELPEAMDFMFCGLFEI